MQVKEFIDKCVDSGYEWCEGECEGKAGYFIRSKRLNTKAHFTTDAIENNNWAKLDSHIVQGKDVYHVTRVVGYYSKTQNWNKSKLGELENRHAGDYAVR